MAEIHTLTLVIHAFSTLALVGLIWTIQVVHYPLFAQVGQMGYAQYQRSHMRRISWVVAPLMLAEVGSAVFLWVVNVGDPLAIAGLALLALIWASTALLQVPCHNRLIARFDREAHARLVQSNWIRTVAWTLRGCLALAMWAGALSAMPA